MQTESEGRFGNLDPNTGGYNRTIVSSIDLFAGTSRSQLEIVGGIAKDGPWGRHKVAVDGRRSARGESALTSREFAI